MTTPAIFPPRRRLGPAAAALLAVLALPLHPGQAGPGLQDLLNGVEARLKAGFTYRAWTADSTTVITELDKNGRPEKITRVSKRARVVDGVRTEDVFKAVVTEDGRDSDATSTYAEDERAREEKERKRREENARKGASKAGRRSGSFDLDEILPFAADKRDGFDFLLRPAAGSPYLVLEARAKTPEDKIWNGVYTIDPARFDILRAEVRPSKNPRFVKELWAEADIETLPGGRLFIKRTKFKIDGGIFIKHVRMIVEDSYTQIRILDAP